MVARRPEIKMAKRGSARMRRVLFKMARGLIASDTVQRAALSRSSTSAPLPLWISESTAAVLRAAHLPLGQEIFSFATNFGQDVCGHVTHQSARKENNTYVLALLHLGQINTKAHVFTRLKISFAC